MRTLCVFGIVLLGCARMPGQIVDSAIAVPRDNYFTLQTATLRVQKDYPSAAPVTPREIEGVASWYDLPYHMIGSRRLHLDLFAPSNSTGGPYPAVVLIHGGGWRSGDRSMEIPMAQFLASKGFVAVTVEYRLSPEARYPAAVVDLKTAVRWLRANAPQYQIDATRIGVYGCSSGGHLATLLGVTNGNPLFEERSDVPTQSAEVQAIVNIDGPVDFTDPEESGKDDDPAKPSSGKRWIGYSYKDRPDLWRQASPLTYVNKKTPPIMFVNSALERYHVGRDEMIDSLRSWNGTWELHTIPDSPHPFWLFHPWFEITSGLVELFLAKTLKTK